MADCLLPATSAQRIGDLDGVRKMAIREGGCHYYEKDHVIHLP
jgi:hypothetical protein